MNSNDFIEEKKRTYLKTEACDWDSHEFCEKSVSIGSKSYPCLCDCHKPCESLTGSIDNPQYAIGEDTYDKLYDPQFDGEIK